MVVSCAVRADDREIGGNVLLIQSCDGFDCLPSIPLRIAGTGISCIIPISPIIWIIVTSPAMSCQLNILSVHKTVLRAVIARSRSIGMILECQGILVPVVVNIDHRIACGADGRTQSGIKMIEMETGILIVFVIDTRIGVIACSAAADLPRLGDRVSDGLVVKSERFFKIVAVACDVLLPQKNRIARFRMLRPLRVQRLGFGEPAAELECVSGSFRILIPAREIVSVPGRGGRFLRDVRSLQELGTRIGTARSVFLEDQPRSARREHRHRYASRQPDLGLVGICRIGVDGCLAAAADHFCVRGRRDIPALEILVRIFDRVILVDRIIR